MSKISKKIVIPSVIAIALVGGGGIYYSSQRAPGQNDTSTTSFQAHNTSSNTTNVPSANNNSDVTSKEDKTGEQTKQANQQAAANDSSSEQPASSHVATPTISITSTNVTTNILHIRTIISGVSDTGSCSLVLSKSGQTSITQKVGTQALASSTTCQGFDVNTNNLERGTWNITITYSNSNGTSVAHGTASI